MIKLILGLILGVNFLLCSACAFYDYNSKAMTIASRAGFEHKVVNTGKFELLTYYRIEDNAQPINVYIEGDGHAFNSHGFISANPTPHNPVALKLASLDSSANVLYIARPYQFVDIKEEHETASKYWTSHRYSEEVVAAVSKVVDDYLDNNMLTSVRLIGFSGGGTIACLLAAKRTDVVKLITVAGNLNIDLHSKLHNVPLLEGSLNPIDYTGKLRTVSQMHFVGNQDTVVPREILNSYLDALDIDESVVPVIVKDKSHSKGWDKLWSQYKSFSFD